MDENAAEIRAADADFVEFRAGGNEHAVDPYANSVRGVRLADWVRDYIDGRPVESLVCDDCTTPELRFTAADLEILERAADLLSEESRWNPEDRRGCEDDERERRWSLYCALVRASREVTGRSGPYWAPDAAVQALVYGTPLGDPEERALPRLWRWGNDPATDYSTVRRVLHATIARVRVELRRVEAEAAPPVSASPPDG